MSLHADHVSRRTSPFPGRGTLRRAGGVLGLSLLTSCGAIPNVEVTADGATVTTESGGSVALTIRLVKRPLSAVEVFATSSDDSEASVSTGLRIDPSNWSQPQIIRVTGLADALQDGDVAYDVNVYARSARPSEGQPQLVTTLHFINQDNPVPVFQGLGDLPGGDSASQVTALSASGEVVVGYSRTALGDEAVRFTASDGLRGLGGAQSRAEAVSPDGSLVVGSIEEPTYEPGRAGVVWRGSEPYELPASPPPGDTGGGQTSLYWFVDGTVVLDDGAIYGTCRQYRAGQIQPIGCRLAADDDIPSRVDAAQVYAADLAGNFAGSAYSTPGAPFNSFAIYDGAPLAYPGDVLCDPPTRCTADASDFSAGGALVVGSAAIPAGPPGSGARLHAVAFSYTTSDSFVRLPDLAGGDDRSAAYAVSADGRLIVGSGVDAFGQQATVWIDRIPHTLADLIAEQGGSIPDDWRLTELRGVSADGKVFAGNGYNAEANAEGFRVALPSAP
jgi:uncharacterized membrane protein